MGGDETDLTPTPNGAAAEVLAKPALYEERTAGVAIPRGHSSAQALPCHAMCCGATASIGHAPLMIPDQCLTSPQGGSVNSCVCENLPAWGEPVLLPDAPLTARRGPFGEDGKAIRPTGLLTKLVDAPPCASDRGS